MTLPSARLLLAAIILTVTANVQSSPVVVTVYKRSHNRFLEVCRGTVLDGDRKLVLSAASCVQTQPEDYELSVVHFSIQDPLPVVAVKTHPSYRSSMNGSSLANFALLFLDEPIITIEPPSTVLLPEPSRKLPRTASLDTKFGYRQVSLFRSDICPLIPAGDKLFTDGLCDTWLGSPLFESTEGRARLVGLVAAIPEPCDSSKQPCDLQLTDLSRYSGWIQSFAAVPLPDVPALAIFSFLKLLAVIGSLGGISFVFCCVMFLITNK